MISFLIILDNFHSIFSVLFSLFIKKSIAQQVIKGTNRMILLFSY